MPNSSHAALTPPPRNCDGSLRRKVSNLLYMILGVFTGMALRRYRYPISLLLMSGCVTLLGLTVLSVFGYAQVRWDAIKRGLKEILGLFLIEVEGASRGETTFSICIRWSRAFVLGCLIGVIVSTVKSVRVMGKQLG